MTELEKHLLNAFERLEKHYNEQQISLDQAQKDLQKMFEHTSQENQKLQRHIMTLSTQVNTLSKQVMQLEKSYNTNRR